MSTGFVLKARPAWAGAPRSRAPHDGGGPDWVRVAAAGEGRVAAGPWFALYARSTPAAPQAAQAEAPMVLDHFALAHVGRVDNRAEVAERAGRPELARAGDGLVLAAAYARWGASLPAHVLGEYAFVVVDRRHESVVGASDSLGIYPLFYAQRGGALVVASCLSLLLDALGDVPPLDARAIEEYLAFGGAIASVRTLYAGVRRVATGCALTRGGAGEVREQRVWRPDPKAPPVRSSDELDEALRALLGDAVRAAARSNGRVCSDLSGGLDSSTVTAMAAQLRERGELDTEIAAFSIVHTRTARSDESAFQRAVLERYRLQQVVLDGDACVALDEPGFGAEGAVRRPGAPSFDVGFGAEGAVRRPGAPSFILDMDWEPPWQLLLSARARRGRALLHGMGIRTRLSGLGGDQVFCGDGFPPLHLWDHLRGGRAGQWLAEVSQWARTGRYSLWRLLRRFSVPGLKPPIDELQMRAPDWLRPEVRARVDEATREPWIGGPRVLSGPAAEAHWRTIAYIARVVRFVRLEDEDVRCPLLYRPLVELLLSLPWDQKLRPDQDRVIQRRALRGILPDAVRLRSSKGDFTPFVLKALARNRPLLAQCARGERLASLGVVDSAAFRGAADGFLRGLAGAGAGILYASLTLEMWLRHRPTRAPDEARRFLASPADPSQEAKESRA